ncbi:RTA1 like protein-domain-containing protein [Mycena rosella]|uniref:RTA1 like protein-domain-containing protein n=1 Tax=Mycena rosella TaxID=1033263 RepID=A0AAD7G0K7_MYCRO|nr:RTA1 like protein-domain-containing protein [Mycena rosella]
MADTLRTSRSFTFAARLFFHLSSKHFYYFFKMIHVQCLDPRDPNNAFMYCPSFPAAVLFSALFGLTLITHFIQAIHYRKRFCWVIIMAAFWETAGLILRVFSVLNPTSTAYGLPSQLLILLAPLLINAFLYMLMSRVIYVFLPDKHVGGISAQRLSLCFVLFDITAFLMQAGGGTMISSDTPKIAVLGIHIYMGGIGLQQFFVLGFIGLVVRFHYKMNRLGGSTEWKRPLYTMYASLALITLRIVFRLIEFSSGLYSPITMHEAPFYCLEATPMFLALLLWNISHPGQVLIGSDSEFPKKVKKSKKSKGGEKELPESPDSLRLVSTPSPPF